MTNRLLRSPAVLRTDAAHPTRLLTTATVALSVLGLWLTGPAQPASAVTTSHQVATTPLGSSAPASAAPPPAPAAGPSVVPWHTPALAGAISLQELVVVDHEHAVYFATENDDQDVNAITGSLVLIDVAHRSITWKVPWQNLASGGDYPQHQVVVGDVLLLQNFSQGVVAVDLRTGGVRSTADSGWALAGCSGSENPAVRTWTATCC